MRTAMALNFTVFNNVNECKKGPFIRKKDKTCSVRLRPIADIQGRSHARTEQHVALLCGRCGLVSLTPSDEKKLPCKGRSTHAEEEYAQQASYPFVEEQNHSAASEHE